MAGVAFTHQVEGLQALADRLSQLQAAQVNELLEQVGATVESQTRRRLSEEKEAPDGSPWEELSDDWQARKSQQSSGGLLEYQGHLLDSMAYQVNGDEVSIGTNLIYGAIHQFGGDPVGIPVPARPYLGLSAENERELSEVIEAWLNQLLK